MAENLHNVRDEGVVDVVGEQLRSAHTHWRKEFHTTVSQVHFAKKRNVPSGFVYLQGKLQTFELNRKACLLGLGELTRYVDHARFEFSTTYNKIEYPEMEDLTEKFDNDPNVEHLDRRYRSLCDYEDNMLEIVARLKISLEPANRGEPLESDNFVVIHAVEDYTLEITMKIREAEIIEMYMSKILRCIHRSIIAIKSYHTIKDEKYKNMTEEEILASPAANFNLFEDNQLRVLKVRHRNGVVKLEDGPIEIPDDDLLDALSDVDE